MARNMWDSLGQSVRNKNMALFVWLVGLCLLIGAAILSKEDWTTSYHGYVLVEQRFGIKTTTEPWVLVAMAVIPWLAQIGGMVFYTLDTSRKWALGVVIVFATIDLVSDAQYHSQGNFLLVDNAQPLPVGVSRLGNAAVSIAYTLVFFTFGAELLFTMGFAIVTTLFAPAVEQMAHLWVSVKNAGKNAGKIIRDGDRDDVRDNFLNELVASSSSPNPPRRNSPTSPTMPGFPPQPRRQNR